MMLETQRGSFEVHRRGDGTPKVLLLHPLALSGRFWSPLADYLSRSATVLALDAAGHGGSPWGGEPITVESMADDAASVIEAVGGQSVAVMGMSMGGCTAMALAARRPDLVDRLVLADTTSCYGPERVETWNERARNAQAKSRPEQGGFQLDRWFSERFRVEHPEQAQRVVDIFLATDSAVHAAACRALGAFDGTSELENIKAETLVLVGEEDYATPVAMAEVIAERIPRARLEVLRNARHLSLLEREDVWPALATHLGIEAQTT